MENQSEFRLTFQNVSTADANKLAQELERELSRAGIQVSRRRDSESAQDFGATLVLVLGTPAVLVAARSLHAWVQRKNAGRLRIEDDRGTLVAENIESKDAPALAEAFNKRIAAGN
jgi:hypothetical protein